MHAKMVADLQLNNSQGLSSQAATLPAPREEPLQSGNLQRSAEVWQGTGYAQLTPAAQEEEEEEAEFEIVDMDDE
jgi:hypothetical protein